MSSVFGNEVSGERYDFRVYGRLETVLAGPVWVGGGVVGEFSETLGAALLQVGLIVVFEPVLDEAASAGERCFQGRGVVPAAQLPMPSVGGADLWQGVQSMLLGAVQPSTVAQADAAVVGSRRSMV